MQENRTNKGPSQQTRDCLSSDGKGEETGERACNHSKKRDRQLTSSTEGVMSGIRAGNPPPAGRTRIIRRALVTQPRTWEGLNLPPQQPSQVLINASPCLCTPHAEKQFPGFS